MHVKKCCKALWKLTESGAANLQTFVTASILLDGLEKENNEIDVGWRTNGTVREKLGRVRSWFEILCHIGEDCNWREDNIRDFIRQDLSVLEDNIAPQDGSSSNFKRWPLVTGPNKRHGGTIAPRVKARKKPVQKSRRGPRREKQLGA